MGLAAGHFLDRGFRSFAYFRLTGLSCVVHLQKSFAQAVKAAGGECTIYAAKPAGVEMDWIADLTHVGEWLESLAKPVAMLA